MEGRPESTFRIPVVHHFWDVGGYIWVPVDHMEPTQEHDSSMLAPSRRRLRGENKELFVPSHCSSSAASC